MRKSYRYRSGSKNDSSGCAIFILICFLLPIFPLIGDVILFIINYFWWILGVLGFLWLTFKLLISGNSEKEE